MKLLYDHNLSPRLIERLADIFLGTEHVASIGLASASDTQIWTYAAQHEACIVSKDSDFNDRSVLHKHPPKVLWLKVGNCTTPQLETLIRANAVLIHEFLLDSTVGLLLIHKS